ncbi:MORN repeat-containing protein 3-like [Anomaloglossus baeobatrachus]|uniref:MORN repeat-containing protein 3-like n=1 Tax=Anomaloglossus baeobatrachus TaxID=238106 RepID=UPI003F508560
MAREAEGKSPEDSPEEPRPQRRRRPPSRYSPSPPRPPARKKRGAGRSTGAGSSRVLLPLRYAGAERAASTPPAGGSADRGRVRQRVCEPRRQPTAYQYSIWPPPPAHGPTSHEPMAATPPPLASETAAGLKAQKLELKNTIYFKNGDSYRGEWMDDRRHGIGTYIYKTPQGIYQGDWIHGKRSGYGTYDGKLPGSATYIRVYAGNWRNDRADGYGIYYYSKDEYYEGGWVCGQRSGYGKMNFANGDIYEGEWRKDKYSGRGMLFYANKDIYKGFWRKGMKHGPGRFYNADTGKIYKEVWSKVFPPSGTLDFGRRNAPNTKKPIPKGKAHHQKESSKKQEVHLSKRNYLSL